MDHRFRAFSFVDRITSLEPGASIRGRYTIPPTVDAFPASLVAEAVGQLAAWAAMATVDFSHRPVAGIAGAIELLSVVKPGQVVDLAAEMEAVDTDAAGYCGTAQVDGRPVVRLRDCVGPMVPVEEFDDPDAVRERCRLLCADGVAPGGFPGLPPLTLECGKCEGGRLAQAVLRVPPAAPLFADHFPRRPVFPGTLVMHANLETAAMLAREAHGDHGAPWVARTISEVKLRSFIPPGATLNLEARQIGCSNGHLTVAVESRVGQRLVCSAEILFSPEVNP
jgi:3-hydroxymyristoyl/3-hydroxydecanoyl-(acyl carrier protein) dehydratase